MQNIKFKTLLPGLLCLLGSTKINAQNGLIEFKIYRSDCYSVLTWTTPKAAKELMFEVEKSYNEYDFIKIGETTYSGVYYHFKTYEYTDIDTNSRPIYYRLKLIKPDYQEILFTEKTLIINK